MPEPNEAVTRWATLVGNLISERNEPRPPRSLVLALIDQESSGNPQAVSPAGAIGLMQVMPKNHPSYSDAFRKMFRDRPSVEALMDPPTNIRWGLRILTDYYHRCGDWPTALVAYFTGRCDGDAATDVSGASGSVYRAVILKKQPLYRSFDMPEEPDVPFDHTDVDDLKDRVAELEKQNVALQSKVAQHSYYLRAILNGLQRIPQEAREG